MPEQDNGYEPVKENYPKPKYIFARNDTRPIQWADVSTTATWTDGFYLVRRS